MMPDKPEPIEKLIEKFFREAGEEQRYRESKVFQIWNQVVGEEISQNAQPVMVENGRLVVAVRNSLWLSELGFERHKIKRKLNRRLGKGTIREISFRIGNIPELGSKAEVFTSPQLERFAPSQLKKEIEIKLEKIKDPELRESLKNLLSWQKD